MNYPEIALAGTMFHVLREAIVENDGLVSAFAAMDSSIMLFEVQLDPPLSETIALSDFEKNLPIWKDQFAERAKMFPTPRYEDLFLIGYEIGQLATWLIGTLPNMTEFPDVNSRKIKALESMEVIKELCAECEEPITVREMLDSTANTIRASTNMDDLKTAADQILDWRDNGAIFNLK